MLGRLRRAGMGVLVMAGTLSSAGQAQAGPFIDWLLGRPIQVYPAPQAVVPQQVGYAPGIYGAVPYPTTAGYAPQYAAPQYAGQPYMVPQVVAPQYDAAQYSASYGAVPYGVGVGLTPTPIAQAGVPNGAVTAYYAPTGAAVPVTAAQPVVPATSYAPGYAPGYPPAYGQAYVAPQPVVVGYAPSYRTNWLRVPVTYYRPVTTYSAGYPVVAGQPCNTYTYQAQRVPTLVQRPWLPFVGGGTTYAYYAPQPTTVLQTQVPSGVPCVNCPTAASPAPYGGVPYGGVPNGSAPYGTAATGVPGNGAAVYGAAPTYVAPATSGAPADQAPSLLQPSSAGTVAPMPDYSTTAPTPGTTAAGAASVRKEVASPYRVTPIPVPDLQKFEVPRPTTQAPPLLNGRERTVSNGALPPRVVEQASWTTAPSAAPSAPRRAAPQPLWNDSGWSSVRP